jgi:hypothetical protein
MTGFVMKIIDFFKKYNHPSWVLRLHLTHGVPSLDLKCSPGTIKSIPTIALSKSAKISYNYPVYYDFIFYKFGLSFKYYGFILVLAVN